MLKRLGQVDRAKDGAENGRRTKLSLLQGLSREQPALK